MPLYRYQARDARGKAHEGSLTAGSLDALEQLLREQSLFLVSAVQGSDDLEAFASGDNVRDVPIKRRRLIEFTIELENTYTAGIPLLQALDDFSREEQNEALAKLFASLAQKVKQGASFSQALATYPKAFPRLYTALVEAGEKTGALDKVLRSLTAFLEWQDELIAQTKQATIYPASILVATAGLVILLVGYVIPQFLGVFASLQISLPWPTRFLIWASDLLRNHALLLIAGLVLFIFSFIMAGRTPQGRWIIDTVKLRLPIFGPLNQKLLLSRLTHNLGMMLGAGMEVAAAFTLTSRLMDNVVMADLVGRSLERITAGGRLSDALGESRWIPRSMVRKLVVGESTGRIDVALEMISTQYDREIPRALKKFFSILEPTMLFALGGIVGFIALALFMPLYQLQSAIGK